MNDNIKTSHLISSQVPAFVRTDHPDFITFLKAYYEWMETEGPGYDLKTIPTNQDLSGHDIDSLFLKQFRKEFIPSLPQALASDPKFVIKKIKDYYRSKGTEDSFKFLLRILFDAKNIGLYYPRKDLLRTSNGKWYVQKCVRVAPISGSVSDFLNLEIIGETSRARAIVEKVNFSNGIFQLTFEKNSLVGDFLRFEKVYAYSDNSLVEPDIEARVQPTIYGIDIVDGGREYKIGDLVSFSTCKNAYGKVTRVTITPTAEDPNYGKIEEIEILNSGWGFSSNLESTVINIDSQSGTGFSGNIIWSHDPVDAPDSGTLIFPGRFLTADGFTSAKTKRVQDSYYWQLFSYDLISSLSKMEYDFVVGELLHPIGLKRFYTMANWGSANLKDTFDASTNIILKLWSEQENVISNGILEYSLADTYFLLKSVSSKWADSAALGSTNGSLDILKNRFVPNDRWPTAADRAVSDAHWQEIFKTNQKDIILAQSPTLALLPGFGITSDSNRQVSAWVDQGENEITFAQGTAANKPSLRRTDNKENYVVISEPQDDTQTAYEAGTYSFVDSVSAEWQGLVSGKVVKIEPHATATEVYVASPLFRLAGTTYRYSFYIRREDGGVVKVGAHNDNTADCVLIYTGGATANIATAANIQTESLGSGLYRVSYEGTRTLASAASGYIGVTKYAANSANNVLVSGFQMTSLEASTEYLPIRTYNAPQYRKISEVPSLVFNGNTSSLTSIATVADIFAAGEKTAFFVFKSNSIAAQRRLFKSSDNRIIVYNPAGAEVLRFYNDDGSADNVSVSNFTVDTTHIFTVWQTGGTLYGQLDGGNIASVASGNTSALTGTLIIGAHTGEYFYGDLYGIVTFDTALNETDRTEIYTSLQNLVSPENAYLGGASPTLEDSMIGANDSYWSDSMPPNTPISSFANLPLGDFAGTNKKKKSRFAPETYITMVPQEEFIYTISLTFKVNTPTIVAVSNVSVSGLTTLDINSTLEEPTILVEDNTNVVVSQSVSLSIVVSVIDAADVGPLGENIRRSVPGPIVSTAPVPDSSISAEDRRTLANVYRKKFT